MQDLSSKIREKPKEDPLDMRSARDAIRRLYVHRIETAYEQALAKVGDKIEAKFIPHAIASALELVVDATFSFWESGRSALSSDAGKGIVYSLVGGDVTRSLMGELSGEKSVDDTSKAVESTRQVFKVVHELDEYARALATYAAGTKMTPDQVLKSPQKHREVIKKAYGSFAEYKRVIGRQVNTFSILNEQAQREGIPPLAEVLSKFKHQRLDGIRGASPLELFTTLARYSKDTSTFMGAFAQAYKDVVNVELRSYQAKPGR